MIRVALDVNEELAVNVRPDQPLVFRVSILNHGALFAENHNLGLADERAVLDRLLNEKRIGADQHKTLSAGLQELPVEHMTLGSKEQPWWTLVEFRVNGDPTDRAFRSLGGSNPIATLDAMSSSIAEFLVDSWNDSGGPHEISACVATDAATVVCSDPVMIRVEEKGPMTPDSTAELIRGEALLRSGDVEGAQAVASALLERHSSDLRTVLLAGDVQMKLGRYKEALAHFERALALFHQQFPKDDEPPQAIYARILTARQALPE